VEITHFKVCVVTSPKHYSPFPIFSFFSGGVTPYDGVPDEEVMPVHSSLTVIFSTLAAAGMAFAVACLVFNFIFRNRKLVRNLGVHRTV